MKRVAKRGASRHEVGAAYFWFPEDTVGAVIPAPRIHQRSYPMYMTGFVCLLSDDEVNQYLAPGLGAAFELNVQVRSLAENLPDGDCWALILDLDSVAPERRALRRFVKELCERPHPYLVAAIGYSLEDDQITDLRDAGILVFQHGLSPAVFAAIAERLSDVPSEALVG